MSKKTVSVVEMLEFANESLAQDYHSLEFKQGICAMIEKILHKSDNYNGFMFLDADAASIGYEEVTKRYSPNAAYFTRKYFSPKTK
jgi:hypothetical protein